MTPTHSVYGKLRNIVSKGELTSFRNFADHAPAPIIKDVGVNYSLVRFQGSLLKQNDFKLDPGPEVDAAWKSLGADCTCCSVRINVKFINSLHKTMQQGYQRKKQRAQALRPIKSRSRQNTEEVIRHTSKAFTIFIVL
jgi:hypothetical protein